VDFGHQRAGRVEYLQLALPCFLLYGLRYAVCAEYDGAARRDFIKFLDEDRAFRAQVVYHKFVMDDLVANVNRCAVHLQCTLDDFDRTVNTSAEPTGIGKQDLHGARL
jgi:hypothetical protein